MEIIIKGNPGILQFITPIEQEETTYKASQCLIREDTPDGVILGNTFTGEAVLLSSEEMEAFDHPAAAEKSRLEMLIRGGYIIPEATDEKKRVLQLRKIILMREERKKYINRYTILTTTDCNARCFYCYEKWIRHENMTEETAETLVQFIAEHRGGKRVILDWFGGEPTLGAGIIDYICNRMNELDIPFSSCMISNGYLFDEEMAERAQKLWKLRSIQITLDGTENVYNRTKAYVHAADNPFERVIRNIGLLLDRNIKVDIRLNLGVHNAENLNQLVEYLFQRFKNRKNLYVYTALLFEYSCPNPAHCGETGIELHKIQTDMKRNLESKGYIFPSPPVMPKLIRWSCMANNPHSIICAPDGTIGKCEHFAYDHTVGSLPEGITDREELTRWEQTEFFNSCDDCPLIPSCRFLLKNCPERCECSSYEKMKGINRCRIAIRNEYEKWKQNNKNDAEGKQRSC